MALAKDWQDLEDGLPDGWIDANVSVTLEEASHADRAVELLAPLQPVRSGPDSISLRIVRAGAGAQAGPSAEGLRRGLARLDAERLHGALWIGSVAERPAETEAPPAPTLPASWDAALATVPADWSDILGEIELDSSDYLEPGALNMAPINPRRVAGTLRLQFRSASRFGYGATPGMVRRCLERCDAAGMTGHVTVLRVLSDTHPVGTQGPVWQIDGRMV
ncbi:MAG TPA: hypothetical protein VH063_07700 [Gaiellaceae bacterium]|jgi:hypothetical protein|nr:hypothetical protein [Gaiellaceae bacterium]